MLRSLVISLLLLPFIHADTSVDVTGTVTQPDDNTYCVSGVCLSINTAPVATSAPKGDNPTQAPSTNPGTVVVQKAPTCDTCEAGVFVFYMQPTCCSDGSVCDIASFLSSGSLSFPSDCGATGSAAITFDACKCQFYCNDTLGNGGNPTLPPTTVVPTLPPTTVAPTDAPTTVAPTTPVPTDAPTTQAPTTVAPTTVVPTLAPTTKAPTTKAPTTKAPTKAPTTVVPTIPPHGGNPTQPPTTTAPTHASCDRCNSTHIFFVVFPVCCSNQLISLCNNTQIANAAKHLPDNCDQDSITWDGCSCSFYCNTTSSTVIVNPNQQGNAGVLPVPQSDITTDTFDIHFNITNKNNTHCIAGTSICITFNGATQHTPTHVFVFPLIVSVILGLVSFF